MSAIPFRIEKSEGKRYFDTYYYHCIDCGAEYWSHHCTSRTVPYCSKCKKKHNNAKAKELADKREAEKIRTIRNKAIDDFFNELQKYEETDEWVRLKISSIYEIAEQLKAENNDL